MGSARSVPISPPLPMRNRTAGGKHSGKPKSGLSVAFGSPSITMARTLSSRPIALKVRISSLTQCETAECGEQTTIR